MLPVLLDQLLNLLQVRGAAVAMRDPVTGGIVIELGRGEWARATHTHLPPHEGISAQVMATRQPYVSSDIRSDERFTWPDLLGATNAVACVPLIAQEQAIGVLGVGGDTLLGEAEVRLLMAVADMAANAIHRASLHEQTEQSLRRLAALRTIDMAISASLDLRMTLDIFLSQVTAQLSVDAAAVLLLDPHTQLLRYVAGRGFRGSGIDRTQLRLGEGRAGYAALERQIVKIPNLAEDGPDSLRAQLLASEEIVAYYAAPLLAKGQVTGVLEIFHRSVLEPDSEWLRFLEALAGQAAIAIENATLFESLERSNIELTLAYDATIEGWSRALDLRDRETEGHSERVTEMTLRLARL
ncbi:MAG: GAF domain-containing protein, partial [Anaerolineales bacterium]